MWKIHPHIKYAITYHSPGMSAWKGMDIVLEATDWCYEKDIQVDFHDDYNILVFTNEKDMLFFMLGYVA